MGQAPQRALLLSRHSQDNQLPGAGQMMCSAYGRGRRDWKSEKQAAATDAQQPSPGTTAATVVAAVCTARSLLSAAQTHTAVPPGAAGRRTASTYATAQRLLLRYCSRAKSCCAVSWTSGQDFGPTEIGFTMPRHPDAVPTQSPDISKRGGRLTPRLRAVRRPRALALLRGA